MNPQSTDADTGTERGVLMIALQFPPFAQSTGRLRTLSFVRHLPAEGWTPIMISARESAYPEVDLQTLKDIPEGTQIIRAWGFDIARAVSIRGLYPRRLATPDRWVLWSIGAIWAGLRAARQYVPRVLWATFPVPSALLAVLALHRLTRIPFIADLRDPLVYESWPATPWDRRVYGWLERRVVRAASAVVVTTPGAAAMYRARYPEQPSHKFCVIANGVEDAVATLAMADAASGEGPITLVHSGVMETPDRSPVAFFEALRMMRARGALPARGLRVVLRGSGFEKQYAAEAAAKGVGDIVELAPHVARKEALLEVASASGLLLFQGPECNRQIPAKAYEYLASGKPMIGLMHPDGDTHALVHGAWGVPYAADMNAPERIADAMTHFFADFDSQRVYVPSATLHAQYTRRARATELGRLLDAIADESSLSRGSVSRSQP